MAKATQLTLDQLPPTVSTTDGSTTVSILTVPAFAASNGGQEITFDVVGHDFTNNETASAKISVKLKNVSGAPSMIGSPVHLIPINAGSSSGLVTASVNVVIDGTNLKVNVIGVAGRTIFWSATRWPSVQVLDGYTATNPLSITGLAAGGDLSGTFPNPTVTTILGGQTPVSTVTALGGDLSGTTPNATVAKIQGRAVNSGAPSTGDTIIWNGSQWVPGNELTVGLDLLGTADQAYVVGLYGKQMQSTVGSPDDGYVLTYTGGYWQPMPAGLASVINMAGDVTGTTAVSVVSTISGSSNIVTLGSLGSAFTMRRPPRVSDLSTSNLNITGQAAYSSAVTGSNMNGGAVQITGGTGGNSAITNVGGYVYIDGGAKSGSQPGSVDGYIYLGSNTAGYLQIQAGSDATKSINVHKTHIDISGLEATDTTLNGSLAMNQTTASSATAGAGSALPATPEGYIIVNIGGSNRKIPYYVT
jgi:hypothetical protein